MQSTHTIIGRPGKLKFILPLIILLMLAIGRVLLPGVLHKQVNKFLGRFSPTYALHVDDMDISFFRMAYTFQGVSGKMKATGKFFLKIDNVDVSIAWRELFRGRILSDVMTDKLDFVMIKNIAKLTPPKKDASELKKKLFPIKVERFDLRDASVEFEGYKSITDGSTLKIDNIYGRVMNITSTEKTPLTLFDLSANILHETSKLIFVGELNSLKKPLTWNLDAVLKDQKLTSFNPFLKQHLPLTFTRGTLDLYSEAKSEKGKVVGYVKPFFKDIDVVASKEKFMGAKHFGIEMVTALVNLILRQSKTKSVATILDFEYDKNLKVNAREGFKKALKHGNQQQRLNPGIEDKYQF